MATKKTSQKASTKVTDDYGASSLEHLTIREQVRRRPGMWIGNSSSKGLHHLIHEIVDNSVDEFMAGHGDLIEVTIDEDQWVHVRDHARGIPVDTHKSGMSGLELVLTQVGGGGKYGGEDSGYKVSGGLHGAGSSVVNFVSSEMKATIRREGFEWHQTYKTGIPEGPIKKGKKSKETGTEISWRFDEEIFEKGIRYERETVERRLRELAYLNPGLTISLDFHGHKPVKFYAEGGLSDYMKALVADRDGIEAVHKAPLLFSGSVSEEIEKDGKQVTDTTFTDVALFWTTAQNESWHAFVNSINTPDGGTHYDGLRSGLRKALNDAADELGKFRAKDEPFEQVDTREGLFLAVSAKVSDPQFEGQTKGKLNNPEVQKRVSDFVAAELKNWLLAKENKAQADRILDRVIEARDGRLAARKAKRAVTERKGLLGASGLPGKLADARVRDREQTEIFIVEGDSAGGGMKQARNRETQAVMPLRGKIQNAEKAGEKTLESEAIKDILSAIGGTVTDIKVPVKKNGKIVNRTKLIVDASSPRYGKVVICSVDGEEMTFIKDPSGAIRCVQIGPFIDALIERGEDTREYEVLCFSPNTGATRFKELKAVIRHPIYEPLHEITTAYGRKVRVTSSHSVFVYEDGKIMKKKGDEISEGDLLLSPRKLPLSSGGHLPPVDLVKAMHGSEYASRIWLRGGSIADLRRDSLIADMGPDAPLARERVALSASARDMMRAARKARGLKLSEVASACGVKQAASVSEWETGRTNPSVSTVTRYCAAVGIEESAVLEICEILPAQIDSYAEEGSERFRKARSVCRLSDLSDEEVSRIGDDVVLTSEKRGNMPGVPRYMELNESAFFLIGLYLAEGSISSRSGVRFSLDPSDVLLVEDLRRATRSVFNQEVRRYEDPRDTRGFEVRIGSQVVADIFSHVFGFKGQSAKTKRIPDIVFGAPRNLQLECLRAYYLGDGHCSKQGALIATTASDDLASQLVYLLSSFGLVASQRKFSNLSPTGAAGTANTVSVCAGPALTSVSRIWRDHHFADRIKDHTPVIQRCRTDVGEDLVGLPVRSNSVVEPSSPFVYDFSVEGDETFICGVGGVACSNTDADVDGGHITTLLLTFFFRYARSLIEEGRVYIAELPLYRIEHKAKGRLYLYNEDELADYVKRDEIKKRGDSLDIQRFKGLGEMMPAQLAETALNPETRRLRQVTLDDEGAAEDMTTLLMGSRADRRREFIEENAANVEVDV